MEPADLDPDPIAQFLLWLVDATEAGLPEPSAMVLATADADARPLARHVLLKEVDERGFVWFTNYESTKARQLAENPHAALVFPWFPIRRQVIAAGSVERLSAADSDAYFATRERDSQLGAWASPQSQVIPDRDTLEASFAEASRRFADQPVPRPPHWGGFRLVPVTIEFWHGRPNRLHDRVRYTRQDEGWRIERLAP
jgi:pyridoxamine 5'-phosphate oxidase